MKLTLCPSIIALVLFVAAAFLCPFTTFAQGFVWLQQGGSLNDDRASGTALDLTGNIYVTGRFSGSMRLGETNVTSSGGSDIFVAKYSPAGNLLWVLQAGGPGSDAGRAVCVAGTGEIYVTGSFEGTSYFGETNIVAEGHLSIGTPADLFIAKYAPTGTLVWVQRSAGVGGGGGLAVASDELGSSYVAGYHMTFNGERRILVAKRNTNGELLWIKEMAGGSNTYWPNHGNGIAVDRFGNVYVTGSFSTTIAFDSVLLSSAAATDIFLAKYNSAGTLLWVRKGGGSGIDSGNAIALDNQGNPFVAGSFQFTVNLGATNLSTEYFSNSNDDAFLAKYTTAGEIVYAVRQGENASDIAYGVTLDTNGNAYLTGHTYGSGYIFVSKYQSNGVPHWTLDVAYGTAFSIAARPNGEACMVGFARGNALFDDWMISNRGGEDIFLAKVFDEIPPVFLTQPRAQFLRTGSTLQLSVATRSITPVTYQWRLNGTNLIGATNSTYGLSNASTNDAGIYSIEARNSFGVSSRDAVVGIRGKYITGQWDFNQGDLSATVGSRLEYRGNTATATRFTNTLIDGFDASVMCFPRCSNEQGYIMPHGAPPSGGAMKVNDYSLIMDVLWENPTNQQYGSVLQIDSTNNLNGAEILSKWSNGTGSVGALRFPMGRLMTTNTWHRVAFGVSMNPTAVLSKYIDGVKIGDELLNGSIDGTYALFPIALLFTDLASRTLSGCVNSIQFRDYKMSDAEISELGCASAGGIPTLKWANAPQMEDGILSLSISTQDEAGLQSIPAGLAIYASTNINLELSQWLRLTNSLTLSNGVVTFRDIDSTNYHQRFYRWLTN